MLSRLFLLIISVMPHAALASEKWSENWNIPLGYQFRIFPNVPQFTEQHANDNSFFIKPQYKSTVFDKYDFHFEPYYLWDEFDKNRTHFDIRELTLSIPIESSSFGGLWVLGIDKVFWGVTETQHLVDIVNQSDTVASFDANEKLGQPMIRFELSKWGQWQFIAMTGFRERTFASANGRLRSPLPVDTKSPVILKPEDFDLALRWGNTFDKLDIALSHFYGTSREPILEIDPLFTKLTPIYDEINQTGAEIQYSFENLILKSEIISRTGFLDVNDFWAYTLGFEQSFGDFFGTHLGLIVEYSYDDRGRVAPSVFQDDYFLGFRLSLNDAFESNIFIGATEDDETKARTVSFKYNRRIMDNLNFSLKTLTFSNIPDPIVDPLMGVQNDSYCEIGLTQYF
ncbi:MAG: hypothetical protein SGJ18_14190 [Pseudomonadota bacterium]|nr:hypothetical protein [Pseudomonadota bacterium]